VEKKKKGGNGVQPGSIPEELKTGRGKGTKKKKRTGISALLHLNK